MNLFITVHDRVEDRDIELNMTTVQSYMGKTITDLDGSTHICILYIIDNGLRIEEEFSSTADRAAKMEELDGYLV